MPADVGSPAPATIFALSSGHPPAAIAVIRVSGPRAQSACVALMGRLPPPRHGAFARLRDPATGALIDEALALFFPGPKSETGEDVVEFQVHGGRAVIAAMLAVLGAMPGLRLAEPGEFTRRAFDNGCITLTGVEALADLIGAETEAQRRQAAGQLAGALNQRAEAWRARLIEALAFVEARIDFSDEEVPDDLLGRALALAADLRGDISATLAGAQRSERLRDGMTVAIAGPPNAGKSTLLNRIAQREAAIVSPHAGTTRDVIEVHLDLEGYPVTLLDTAGIRASDDPVEQEGVQRARARAAQADLVLWIVDAAQVDAAQADVAQADAAMESPAEKTWRVVNKIDVLPARNRETAHGAGMAEFAISARSGDGVGPLIAQLMREAAAFFSGADSALVTRARHRVALEQAEQALARAAEEGCAGRREDIVAEELRAAGRALDRLIGRVDVENILDVIFRDFCIGK